MRTVKGAVLYERQGTLTSSTTRFNHDSLFIFQLIAGANSARSDDTSCVKPKVAEWLNMRLTGVPMDQHLALSRRDGRGLQHDMTGRLLCPIKYDWDDLR